MFENKVKNRCINYTAVLCTQCSFHIDLYCLCLFEKRLPSHLRLSCIRKNIYFFRKNSQKIKIFSQNIFRISEKYFRKLSENILFSGNIFRKHFLGIFSENKYFRRNIFWKYFLKQKIISGNKYFQKKNIFRKQILRS